MGYFWGLKARYTLATKLNSTRSTLSIFNKVDRVEFNFVASVYRALRYQCGDNLTEKHALFTVREPRTIYLCSRRYSLRRGLYVFTLSVPLSVLMSVPCQPRLVLRASRAGLSHATMAVGQHTVRAGAAIPVPTWTPSP